MMGTDSMIARSFTKILDQCSLERQQTRGNFCWGPEQNLHRRVPGEERYVGDYVFGDPDRILPLGANRDLLIEFCSEHQLAVANTFFQCN